MRYRAIFGGLALSACLGVARSARASGVVKNAAPRPRVMVAACLGGRTNAVFRAYIFGAFDAAGLDVRLLSRDLNSPATYGIAREPESALRQEAAAGPKSFGKMTGVEIAALMRDGRADAGLFGESSFLYSISRGDNLVAVALLGHGRSGRPDQALILRKGVKIVMPSDFRGLRLVTRRGGPGDETFLRELLAGEGAAPADVQITTNVYEGQIEGLLRTGRIDGAYVHLLMARRCVRDGIAELFQAKHPPDPRLSLAVLAFRRDYIAKHPEIVSHFVEAYMRRVRFENALPASQRAKESRRFTRGLTLRLDYETMSLPVYDDVPKVPLELLAKMQMLLLKDGALNRVVDLREFIDNRFVERAARRLQAP